MESVHDNKNLHFGDSEAIVEETTIYRTQANGVNSQSITTLYSKLLPIMWMIVIMYFV